MWKVIAAVPASWLAVWCMHELVTKTPPHSAAHVLATAVLYLSVMAAACVTLFVALAAQMVISQMIAHKKNSK